MKNKFADILNPFWRASNGVSGSDGRIDSILGRYTESRHRLSYHTLEYLWGGTDASITKLLP